MRIEWALTCVDVPPVGGVGTVLLVSEVKVTSTSTFTGREYIRYLLVKYVVKGEVN